ncbi:50S ribosomal protein L16 [Candidatus Vidania fulgoroideorum]
MISKFKKIRKGRNKGFAFSSFKLNYLRYGLKSLGRGFLTFNQIESARKVLAKITKKNGKIIIRVFPNIPRTHKPIEVRMGNGKGDIEKYVYKIKPGDIIFEIDNVSENLIKKYFKLASYKLPFKTIFFYKELLKNL